MKRTFWALLVAVPLSALAEEPQSKPAGPDSPSGRSAPGVNWEGQVIKATGSGAPDMRATNPAQARLGAEQAAKMDAFRNLLVQVKGIQISAGRTVGDAMAKEELRGKVEGIIRGYKVTAKRYFSDSGVELDVEVPLSALAAVLAPPSDTEIALKKEGEARNTGLVVDARGLDVKPVLAPRILDLAGRALYGPEALSEDARKATAVASYVRGLDAAKQSALVGDRPLVLKAAKAHGSDLVLDEAEAKQLAEVNNSFLAEGRVVIVTQ